MLGGNKNVYRSESGATFIQVRTRDGKLARRYLSKAAKPASRRVVSRKASASPKVQSRRKTSQKRRSKRRN